MAKVCIVIDVNGNVPLSHAKSGVDQVYWKAADPTQTWYINFNSPFVDDAIVNDHGNGETKLKKVGKTTGYFPYTVKDTPNLQLSPKKKLRIMSAGGIIIDS